MPGPTSLYVVTGDESTPLPDPLGYMTEGMGFPLRPIQQISPPLGQIATVASVAQVAADLAILRSEAVIAAYGSMGITVPRGITLNGTWTRIINYSSSLASPKHLAYNTAAGTLAVERAGVYRVSIDVALTMTEQNASTFFQMRLFDVTAGSPLGSTISFGQGRNTGNFTASTSFVAAIAGLSHEIAVEIGNGSTFTGVQITDAQYAVTGVSP